jgi:hypothetical protein
MRQGHHSQCKGLIVQPAAAQHLDNYCRPTKMYNHCYQKQQTMSE